MTVLAFAIVLAPLAAASTVTTVSADHAPLGGSIGLRLVDVPVAERNDPRARIYIVDHLAPATVIRRRISVSNTSAATERVRFYAAAATIANGEFLGSAGHTANEVSAWTSVRPGVADVPAGGNFTAMVTIAVPPDAAPGERYGAIWAETSSAPIAADNVHEVNRVGIRLYVSVGPGAPPASNFTIRSLTAERSIEGEPSVVASVHNNGGRALDMSGTLRLSDGPAGLRAGPFPANLAVTLAIDDTEPVTVTLDKQLPAGPWNAQITLHSGLLQRSARATLTFPAAGAGPAIEVTLGRRGWPHDTVGALLLLAAVTAVVVAQERRTRHHRHRRPQRAWLSTDTSRP